MKKLLFFTIISLFAVAANPDKFAGRVLVMVDELPLLTKVVCDPS